MPLQRAFTRADEPRHAAGLVDTKLPAVTGTTKAGQTLTTTKGSWAWDGLGARAFGSTLRA